MPKGDLVDASPAEMRVHTSQDHLGAVLRLERESALDPQHQGCGNDWRVRIAFCSSRRPLQLDRPGVARKRVTDNGLPIGDQACFAQAARGHRLGDQPGREFSQPLGAAPRALHHRFGTESEDTGHEVEWHERQCRRAGVRGKAKDDCCPHACLVGLSPSHAPVACGTWGNARSLSRLALRSPAAADDGTGGDALLSGLHCEMATSRGSGSGFARSRNERVCRSRLLFASAELARVRQGNRPARRSISQRGSELRALPGVGAYTAAAVAAITFGRQTAPVDGNIARVLARLLALEKPIASARGEIAAAARALAPSGRAGDFAQALMDIGATVCRPRNPACGSCPLAQDCAAFRAGAPEAYPRRAEAKEKTAPAGRGVFRPPLRRRFSRSPPSAAWPSRLDD